MQPEHIGGYPVTSIIGNGAFGTVYLAQHPTANVPVAIKTLDRLQASDSRLRAQLHQEVAALLAVRSPYCLQVWDVIDDGTTLAFVTEYVPGATLRTVLDSDGPLAAPVALNVLWGAAQGLAAVHAAGLVHGDVKPANILIDESGQSKVIDFGLTSAPGHLRGDELSPYGSPAYASPEQLTRGYRDARSDIYSLTATLYEVLTQARPFTGRTVAELTQAHASAPIPDPRALVPDLGDDLAGLIMAGLAKDPEDRPQDMAYFLTWFERAAGARWGTAWHTAGTLAAIVGGMTAAASLASGVSSVAGGAAVAAASGGAATGLTATAGGILTTKVALIAAGTVLAIGAATTGVVVATSGGSGGTSSGGTVVDYNSTPPTHWHRAWSEIDPGASPTIIDEYGTPAAAVMKGLVVVALNDGDTDRTVAIDPTSGARRWTRPQTCSPLSSDSLLCGLDLVDASTGRTRSTLAEVGDPSVKASSDGTSVWAAWIPDGQPSNIVRDGEDMGYQRMSVARFDAATGAQIWHHDVTTDYSTIEDHQEYPEPRASADGTVTVRWAGREFLFAADGRQLGGPGAHGTWYRYPGSGIREVSTDDPWSVGIERVDGTSLVKLGSDESSNGIWGLQPDSSTTPSWNHGGVVADGHVGLGRSWYDTATGKASWSLPALQDQYTDVLLSADSATLLFDHGDRGTGDSSLVARDTRTGDRLWEIPSVRGSSVQFATLVGNTGFSLTDGRLQAGDLRTGKMAWSLPSEMTDDDPSIIGADGVVATLDKDGLSVYSGFSTHSTGSGAANGSAPAGVGTRFVTPCGREPIFTPVSSSPSDDGMTVNVTYKVTAVCPGGQYLSSSQYDVPLYADGTLYLDGYFDFSRTTPYLSEAGTTIVLNYPHAYSSSAEINDKIAQDRGTGTVVKVPCKPGPHSTDGPVGGASPTPSPSQHATADADVPQTPEQASKNAKAALDRWVRDDRPTTHSLAGAWLPQLSSKKLGVPASYTSYAQILNELLKYRQLYPGEARLVWSNDWTATYGPSSKGFYVLVRAVSFSTPESVKAWCDTEGWPGGECFPTRLGTGAYDSANHAYRPGA